MSECTWDLRFVRPMKDVCVYQIDPRSVSYARNAGPGPIDGDTGSQKAPAKLVSCVFVIGCRHLPDQFGTNPPIVLYEHYGATDPRDGRI